MSEIQRFANPDELALGAARFFVEQAQQAIAERGRFYVALSGGSTPKAMHQIISEQFTESIDWSEVFIFWGDERSVPPDSDESNFKMAKETLLNHVAIPERNVFRIHAEMVSETAAAEYENQLKGVFTNMQWPRFDLIFLGLGSDGHTASLFPHTAALSETDHWVTANFVDTLDTWRITLTAPVINAASNVVFLVAGESKANVLREVINGPYQPDVYPSQIIAPENGNLYWFVDETAAALI